MFFETFIRLNFEFSVWPMSHLLTLYCNQPRGSYPEVLSSFLVGSHLLHLSLSSTTNMTDIVVSHVAGFTAETRANFMVTARSS